MKANWSVEDYGLEFKNYAQKREEGNKVVG
jgi:hypothetical protein